MRRLIKDSDNNVFEMHSINGFIPPGYTEVSAEDSEAAEASIASQKLSEARAAKLEEVRNARKPKLKRVDVLMNIAYLNSWTGPEKTQLKDYRQALLDITESYKDDAATLDSLDVSAIEWPVEPSES